MPAFVAAATLGIGPARAREFDLALDKDIRSRQGPTFGSGLTPGCRLTNGGAVPARGVVFKRCRCRDRRSGRRLEGNCPRLGERAHGSWYFRCSVPTVLAGTERVRRGGFPSRRAAQAARDQLLEASAEDATAETWTVGRWMAWWLSTRRNIRPTTLRSCSQHVDRHLIPYLGRLRLAELKGRDVAQMFAALSEAPMRHGRPLTPASLHRIRATLRAASTPPSEKGCCGTTRPGRSNCPRRGGRRPRSGPRPGCRPGRTGESGRRWRSGRSISSPSSCASSKPTGCSGCGG